MKMKGQFGGEVVCSHLHLAPWKWRAFEKRRWRVQRSGSSQGWLFLCFICLPVQLVRNEPLSLLLSQNRDEAQHTAGFQCKWPSQGMTQHLQGVMTGKVTALTVAPLFLLQRDWSEQRQQECTARLSVSGSEGVRVCAASPVGLSSLLPFSSSPPLKKKLSPTPEEKQGPAP